MKKDPAVFLEHILECIDQINSYIGKYDEAKFSQERMVQDAVMRRLEIIGEAVKNLPFSFKKSHPDIP